MGVDDGLEPLPASLARTWGNTETPRNWTAAIDAAGDAMGNTETMEGRMSEESHEEDVILRVCECGAMAWTGSPSLTRCGRNGVQNMQYICPTVLMRIVAWEEVADV